LDYIAVILAQLGNKATKMVGGKQFRATPVQAGLGGGGGPPCNQPLVGKQFVQSVLGMAADTFEDVA
jgi:hypothetical protein